MSTLREATQQALEALEAMDKATRFMSDSDYVKLNQAIDALRASLPCTYKCEAWPECACAALAQQEQEKEAIAQNLQSRLDAALLLEARRQEIAQPRRETEQEPVAWRFKGMMGMPWSLSDDGYYASCKRDKGYIVEPLYAHPPRREWQGLSDEEINDGRDQLPTEDLCNWSFRQGVYFAEAKLKEKNNG